MSTALTAQALPEVAGVLLTVTAAPAGELTITRTDSNGAAPVRLLPAQAPIGGSLTVRDYEAALTGPVTYSLLGERANLLTPAQSQPTATTGWAGPALSLVAAPWNAARKAVRVDATTGTPYVFTPTGTGTVKAGSRVTVSALIQTDAGVFAWPSVHRRTANTYLNTPLWSPAGQQYAAVTRISATATLTADASDLDLAILLGNTSGGGTLAAGKGAWVGDVMVEVNAPDGTTYLEEVTPATITATTALDVAKAVLSVARRPALRSDTGTLVGWSESNPSSHLVHYVPERPDPIVLGGRQRLRVGSAVLRFPSYLDGRAAKALGDGEVVLLRVPGPANAGMDLYARVERPELSPAEVDGTATPDWELTLAYTEVGGTEAPLSGAADWTIGDAYDAAPTMRASRLAFPTLRDLAVGP